MPGNLHECYSYETTRYAEKIFGNAKVPPNYYCDNSDNCMSTVLYTAVLAAVALTVSLQQ